MNLRELERYAQSEMDPIAYVSVSADNVLAMIRAIKAARHLIATARTMNPAVIYPAIGKLEAALDDLEAI